LLRTRSPTPRRVIALSQAPELRPIYEALYDLMDARIVERTLQRLPRTNYVNHFTSAAG
jgi:hypothetical protein